MTTIQAGDAPRGRILRSHTKIDSKSKRSWDSLPVEIRWMILDCVSDKKNPGWTRCAAVCRDWRAFIEPKNFSRLILKAPCLEGLESISVCRRDLVRHIRLNIELPRYTCRCCEEPESVTRKSRHSSIFRSTLLKLFSVLSTWKPTGGLTLELNAYSASDSEHWFKSYRFGREHEPADGRDSAHVQGAAPAWHDPKHGWVNGQQVEDPSPLAILRIFSPLCKSLPPEIPDVCAVTGLVIRRQLRRQIPPAALWHLLVKLPRLESIVYEPWLIWRMWELNNCCELFAMVRKGLANVKTVSIFEDCNGHLGLALGRDPFRLGLLRRVIANPLLAQVFASTSRNFQSLSIAYMIDAGQFFDSCQPSYSWHRLQSLALTSSILSAGAPPGEISKLLQDAASVALNMPQLESMAIWNASEGIACAVTYRRNKARRQATLKWRGTWYLDFSPAVVECWRKVVSDSCDLRIEHEQVQDIINSQGDAIYYLRLPDGVIDPVSLRQKRLEAMVSGRA